MYHVKQDKRSQASAAELIRGLEVCLKEKSLMAITVSDLHRVTGISRATFYRLFDTPKDVLEYQFARMIDEIPRTKPQESMTVLQLLEESIAQGMAQHDLWKAMVDNGRFDLIFRYTEGNFRLLDQRCGLLLGSLEGAEREYVISLLAMNMLATLITWDRNGRRETPAQIIGYLKNYGSVVESMMGTAKEG